MIMGVDPGSRCGIAFLSMEGTYIASRTLNLSPGRHQGGGARFLKFQNFLNGIPEDCTFVAYELVRRHLGTDAAHIYGGLIAVLTAWCEQRGIPYAGIPVGTVKKFATGKGNASKHQMMLAAQPFKAVGDDNEADAIHVARAAFHEYFSSGVNPPGA